MAAFHDTDINILATILARMSARMSVSVSSNVALYECFNRMTAYRLAQLRYRLHYESTDANTPVGVVHYSSNIY